MIREDGGGEWMDAQGIGTNVSDEAFLQKRLATLGKVMFIVTMLGVSVRATGSALTLGPESLLKPDFLWNLAGNATFGFLWAVCGGKPRSPAFVRVTEIAVLLVACVSYAMMGIYYRRAALGEYSGDTVASLTFSYKYFSTIVVLTLTYAMAIRAALIPSTAQRTRWITGLVGVPLVVILTHGYTPRPPDESLLLSAIPNVVWWTITVIICGVISTVIYGLRRKVIEAQRLGQYTLGEKIGEGGMGMVYRASHGMLRRPTAIKLLRPDQVKAIDLARFEREVQMTAKLSHPNTVTVFDYGRTPEGIFYYAMELLEGADLKILVGSCGPQPPARVRHILERVSDALSEAHGIGLIHRDIKPSNIILCRQGGRLDVPKVVDFGLVREVAEKKDLALTGEGQLIGTPLYMCPEVLRDPKSADGRSDLYALGAVGYYLLTGQHVFTGSSLLEICFAHVNSAPTPPRDRLGGALPADLEALVLSCLEKDPSARPQSAAELRDRLIGCSDVGPWGDTEAEAWWAEHGDALPAIESTATDTLESDDDLALTVISDHRWNSSQS
jgi:serine/threonine-protein kinase